MPPHRQTPGPLFVVVPAMIAILAILNLHLPYLLVLPGPVEETTALVSIEGAPTYRPEGSMYLTTVVLGPTDRRLMVADYLRAKLDPSSEVVPFDLFYPPQRTPDEIDRLNKADIEDSKVTATTAALGRLGFPAGVTGAGVAVESVEPGMPAEGILRPGDLITALDERTVCSPEDLVLTLAQREPGGTVSLTVWRDGQPRDLSVGTVAHPEQDRAILGVTINRAEVRAPVQVKIDSGNIGGPSAGLLFSLAVTELLESEDLTAGRSIAGTGTISCDGRVGAVGGLAQKLASAERENVDLFLVPADELRQACALAGDLPVIGVSTLDEAVAALRSELPRSRMCSTVAKGRGG